MSFGLVLLNVASLSTSLGAVIALALAAALLRSRGALLLLGTVLCLAGDYVLGLLLYIPHDSPLWLGLAGYSAVRERAALLFGLKGILHVGMLATAPLAAYSLLGVRPSRAVLWTGAGAAFLALAAQGLLLGRVLPADGLGIYAASALPVYLTYLVCLAILVKLRARTRPGVPRAAHRTAIAGLSVFTPLLIAADILGLSGFPRLLGTSPTAFFVLQAGVLVFSLLALAGGRARPAAADVDSFCARNELSARERDVLLLLAQGLRYKQIAERLSISLDTVKTHASHIYRKASASGKTDIMYRIRG
jgi:DNA-binding CsgD family transcriptional regulator